MKGGTKNIKEEQRPTEKKLKKPLGRKAYGSIAHLVGSRKGPADKGLTEQQSKQFTEQERTRHDNIVVLEKFDGSNCCVAWKDGVIALSRSGYEASASPYRQHRVFDAYVKKHSLAFMSLVDEHRTLHLEWLPLVHGTHYDLTGRPPFMIFDIKFNGERLCWQHTAQIIRKWWVTWHYVFGYDIKAIPLPRMLHHGGAISIEKAMQRMGKKGELKASGKDGGAEGVVYRYEVPHPDGQGGYVVSQMAKYVRPNKVDGKYLLGDAELWQAGLSEDIMALINEVE